MNGATVHHLGERRAAKTGFRRSHDHTEAGEWAILADRTSNVLDTLNAALAKPGRWRPGVHALSEEVAGLRFALDAMSQRKILVDMLIDTGVAMGLEARPDCTGSPAAQFARVVEDMDTGQMRAALLSVIDAFGSGGRLLRMRPETPNLAADEREDQ